MDYSTKAPSGVQFKILPLVGAHYDLLTRSDAMEDRIAELIVDVVIEPKLEKSWVKNNMPAFDKKWIVCEARQLSHNFPSNFTYTYAWQADAKSEKQFEKIDIELPDGHFQMRPYRAQADDYASWDGKYNVDLGSGLVVELEYLTGRGERLIANTPEKKRSIITFLRARFPKTYRQRESGSENREPIPIEFDLSRATAGQLDLLFKAVGEHEARVDSELRYEELGSGKQRQVDVSQSIDFLFPSASQTLL